MSDLEYKCSICGEIHEDYPALAFSSPDYYNWLSEDEKKSYNAQLESDFCTIEYPDGVSRFIRVILKQEIIDSELTLDYGLWVSLSENSYNDYLSNYDNENHETKYFGWLSNTIPDYTFDDSIPTTVNTKKGNERPEIVPHSDFKHPFVEDYYNGISKEEEAEKRVHNMLSNIS